MHVLHVRLPLLIEDRLPIIARDPLLARLHRAHALAQIEDPETFCGGNNGPLCFGREVVFPQRAEGVGCWRVGGPVGLYDGGGEGGNWRGGV